MWTDQWNRTETLRRKSYIHRQLISNKSGKKFNEEIVFQQMMPALLDIQVQKNEIGSLPHIIYKS